MSDDAKSGALSGEVNETLKQILRWVRFQNLERARHVLETEIAHDPRRILVYELTDGDKGRPEVARISKVPSGTIQDWWDRWYSLGLLEPSTKRKGMVRKVFAIEDLGLPIPNDVKAALQGRASGKVTAGDDGSNELEAVQD